ncbi:MAG TPA: YfhO family protein [Chloroflexota bacterium]
MDTATQYYPWYAFLGQSLTDGRIPGWNSATFSGAPFAANPLSGWSYLPAMVIFALLPLAGAAKVYLVFHALLAALSAYGLARAAGLSNVGSFVAGLAYANTGFLQIENLCCSPVASIYAWLPLTLLGAEEALRSRRASSRAAWWGLAGLGMSQSVAVWPGQGAYYTALIVGGYIAYRALVLPPLGPNVGGWARIGRVLQHEIWVFTFGAGFAAAGLLPRLELNAVSNLAGGYSGENLGVGGLQPSQWVYLALPGARYVGLSVLALAAAAPFVARCRPFGRPEWYFGITSVGALLLTGTVETPLHWLLYLMLPGFASLHPHAPERILTVAYLGPAMLAGATVSCAPHTVQWLREVARSRFRLRVVAALVAVLVTADLALGGARARADRMLTDPLDGIERLTEVDLATYDQHTGASAFLEQRLAESPSRFVGFAPEIDGRLLPYTFRFADPNTAPLLVNNQAVPLRLQDVQGYDASHLRRYDAFLAALNGQSQNYHDATILSKGLSSPLLDLLNARYVLVPAHLDALDGGLVRFSNTVYEDGQVKILENSSAFPRAWIVHTAEQVGPGGAEGIQRIASGRVDARHTALLEAPPPDLEVPVDASHEQARVVSYEAQRVEIRTSTEATGLLVLSEIYYPAWRAYVDGQPVRLYVADGALRAVSIPVGEHTVELLFESETLRVGMLISSVTALLLVLLGVACITRRLRST